MEDHIGSSIVERLDGVGLVCQLLTYVCYFLLIKTRNRRCPQRRDCRNGACGCHAADILVGHEVQMRKHVALVEVAGDLLGILDATQHEMRGTTAFGVYMNGHALLVGLDN